VIGEVEEALQETLGPRVLSCLNNNASEASIVALDSLPKDSIALESTSWGAAETHRPCTSSRCPVSRPVSLFLLLNLSSRRRDMPSFRWRR
jgi:hypothetical protein